MCAPQAETFSSYTTIESQLIHGLSDTYTNFNAQSNVMSSLALCHLLGKRAMIKPSANFSPSVNELTGGTPAVLAWPTALA